jgi:hypothetical protein
LGNRTRFSILSLLSLIIILGTSQQAMAGNSVFCFDNDDCDDGLFCTLDVCNTSTGVCTHPPLDCSDGVSCTDDSCNSIDGCVNTPNDANCDDQNVCNGAEICVAVIGCQPPLLPPPPLPECRVGGEFIGVDSTSLVLAGTQLTFSWMIPITVSAVGIAIVVARKFSKYQPE